MKAMRMTTAATLTILTAVLTGCDSRGVEDLREERANRQYQTAMDDYQAGRMDAAAAGFEKVIRACPGHASARFQLACLLQDRRKDYLAAYCHYLDYRLLAPDSDKSGVARDRMAMCERLLAEELVKKASGSADAAAIAEESAVARKELADAQAECGRLAARLEKADASVAALTRENERLRKLMASFEEGEAEEKKTVSSVRDLLDADDGNDGPSTDPLDEAKALNALAESEEAEAGAGASILAPQPKDAKAERKAREDAEKAARTEKESKKDEIPDEYVVQDGDTLYKIAIRFYGKTSAWKQIREANKGVISTDGRVRTGQRIRMPK